MGAEQIKKKISGQWSANPGSAEIRPLNQNVFYVWLAVCLCSCTQREEWLWCAVNDVSYKSRRSRFLHNWLVHPSRCCRYCSVVESIVWFARTVVLLVITCWLLLTYGSGTGFLQVRCYSCYPTNSVEALNGTESSYPANS